MNVAEFNERIKFKVNCKWGGKNTEVTQITLLKFLLMRVNSQYSAKSLTM
jgi:hypothetical protein